MNEMNNESSKWPFFLAHHLILRILMFIKTFWLHWLHLRFASFVPPLHQTGDDYIIPGGWTDAEVDQEIVDFAVAQFSGIDQICFHIQAENFQSKVSRII